MCTPWVCFFSVHPLIARLRQHLVPPNHPNWSRVHPATERIGDGLKVLATRAAARPEARVSAKQPAPHGRNILSRLCKAGWPWGPEMPLKGCGLDGSGTCCLPDGREIMSWATPLQSSYTGRALNPASPFCRDACLSQSSAAELRHGSDWNLKLA